MKPRLMQVFTLAILWLCAAVPRGRSETNTVQAPADANIQRIMNACAQCHKPWNRDCDIARPDDWITPGDPINSRLYRMVKKSHMRAATRLADTDTKTVYDYIENLKGAGTPETTIPTAVATPLARTPAGPMPDFHLRIHCGAGKAYKGGDYLDPDGNVWQADRRYVKGGWGYDGGSAHWHPMGNPERIQNTRMEELHRSERSGMDSYRVAVPANGKYIVRLYFAENFDQIDAPTQRIFSIFMGGKEVIKDLDVYREVGSYYALIKTVETEVTDGVLCIEFMQKAQWGSMINAIEVMSKKTE